jgi:hypothetical protein
LQQVSALRSAYRLWLGNKLLGIAHDHVSSINAMQEAILFIDNVEEIFEYISNLEWVFLTEEMQYSTGCQMAPTLYTALLNIIKAVDVGPKSKFPTHLANHVKQVTEYREGLLHAFSEAVLVDADKVSSEDPPKTKLLN